MTGTHGNYVWYCHELRRVLDVIDGVNLRRGVVVVFGLVDRYAVVVISSRGRSHDFEFKPGR